MNIALLTAGGSGMRMGQDIPKQFMNIDDSSIIIGYANRGIRLQLHVCRRWLLLRHKIANTCVRLSVGLMFSSLLKRPLLFFFLYTL